MRIAIVDDRAEDRDKLIDMLQTYCVARRLKAQYTCFSSAEALLHDFTSGAFDLAFLDIYMGEMTGMEAARSLCELDPVCRLVFITTSQTHAIASYEVRAAYYLTKPLDAARLSAAMDVVCSELSRHSKGLAAHSAGADFAPLLSDIIYVDCLAERVRIHLEKRTVVVSERFSDIDAQLSEDKRFLSCNRNVTVNMDAIVGVQNGEFLLKGGERLPIRQRGRARVERAFLQYSLHALEGGGAP